MMNCFGIYVEESAFGFFDFVNIRYVFRIVYFSTAFLFLILVLHFFMHSIDVYCLCVPN